MARVGRHKDSIFYAYSNTRIKGKSDHLGLSFDLTIHVGYSIAVGIE